MKCEWKVDHQNQAGKYYNKKGWARFNVKIGDHAGQGNQDRSTPDPDEAESMQRFQWSVENGAKDQFHGPNE
jgi:hypothetical protein